MQVIVNGLATRVERYGKGQQILVLHGWGDSGRSWRAFAQDLAKQYEVIVPDLPGFGGTEAPHEVWGLDDYTAFAAALVDKMDITPYGVIGHSNGGAIAIRGVATSELKPERLVLLASAGIRGENKSRNTAWRIVAKTGKVVTAPLPAAAKQKLRAKLYHAAGSDMLVAGHLQETFKRVVAEDVRVDAAEVQVPTLLVYGADDTATPPRYGELLADAIRGSQLQVLPGAGHFVQLDAKDTVLRLTEEFLR